MREKVGLKCQWGEREAERSGIQTAFCGGCGKGVRGMDHCLKQRMKGIMLMIKCKDLDELSEVH